MYNISDLREKELTELQEIAQSLGVTDYKDKDDIVYKILDQQAIAGATKQVEKAVSEPEKNPDPIKQIPIIIKYAICFDSNIFNNPPKK